jgi:hypothetical protein
MSELAQEAIDAARLARENTLVVKVEKKAEEKQAVVSGKPLVLDVPESVEVADEFKD